MPQTATTTTATAVPSAMEESSPVLTRLSASAGRRRPSSVLAGGVLVGLAALIGAWVLASVTDRVTVLVAAHELAPGLPIAADDLRAVEISKTNELRAVQPSQQELILGRSPRGPVPAGTVLNTGLFVAKGDVVPAGSVVVGAALEPGAAPSGELRSGDPVQLLVTTKVASGMSGAAVRIGQGTIWSVEGDGQAGSSKAVVALLVSTDLAEEVAQAASEGTLRLALGAS